jgi:hypothetical protein
LRNPKFFKKCSIGGITSFTLGILLELIYAFNMETGLTILYMSTSIIYLGYFHYLSKLFKSWKGTDPYITSSSSSIGGIPIDGLWTKYPQDRKIIETDFYFSFAQALLPIFTIFGLAILLIELNR